jgi:EpsI family protein
MVGFVLWASRFVGDDDRPAKALTPPATGSWVKENAGTHIATSAVLTLLALAIGPALMSGYRVDRDAMRPPHLDLSEEISGWRAVTVPADAYRPVFTGSDAEYERIFRSDGDGEVYLYVAQYAYQEQGKEAVSETNGVHDPKRWTAELARTLRLPNGVTVRQTRIRSHGGTEKLVWQWYHVHGRTVSSDYLAKLLNVWGTLGGDPAIAVVVVAAELDGNDDRAAARLSRFVAEAWQTVERAIEHAPKRQRSAGSALSPRT